MNKIKILFFLISFIALNEAVNAELLHDEFIENKLNNIDIEEPENNTQYNYESVECIPIKLKIQEEISTKKNGIQDAQELKFAVRNNVKYNDKIVIRQGTEVKATIGAYMSRGMNGIPASIIVDNFRIEGFENNKIKGLYIKRGLNLSLLVFPIKWALTPIPGVGSLTNFIIGGNAKITPKDTVMIYYYPDWGTNNINNI